MVQGNFEGMRPSIVILWEFLIRTRKWYVELPEFVPEAWCQRSLEDTIGIGLRKPHISMFGPGEGGIAIDQTMRAYRLER